MTNGQVLFYGGIALFSLALILMVVFAIKKPKYKPDNAVYSDGGGSGTQKLRNGYPTDRLTIQRQPEQDAGRPTSAGTAPLVQGTTPLDQGTVPLDQGTVPLDQGTVPLDQGTVPLDQGTVPLDQDTVPLDQGTP